MDNVVDRSAMEEATEGIQELAFSVSSPLRSFVRSLNASSEEVEVLLSSTGEWLGELERGMLLRLDAFNAAHRQAPGKVDPYNMRSKAHIADQKKST